MPSDNELLQIQNLKKNLDDKIVAEAKEATRISRERAQAIRDAKDRDIIEAIKNGAYTYEGDKRVLLWDKLASDAHRVINADQMAYNDWRSAMMSLLSLFSTLVDALSNTIEQQTGPLSMQVKRAIREYVAVPLKNKIIDAAWGDQPHDIPALLHSVNFSDDDKLQIGDLKRADNGDMTDELNAPYRTLVTLWLNSQGYKLAERDPGPDGNDRNRGVYVNDAGARLTKAVFDGLKNDENHGLTAFLQRDTGLEFKPSSAPTPSP